MAYSQQRRKITMPSDNSISKGNVCVTDRGQLFVAMHTYKLPAGQGRAVTWYGVGFNGQVVYSEHCLFVASNLNEYLQDTYGNNFAKEIAEATNPPAPSA